MESESILSDTRGHLKKDTQGSVSFAVSVYQSRFRQ